MVFYRKYRPQTFTQVIGQAAIKQSLLSALQHDSLAHAYLFSGPKGSGKTSTARILAKAVNCEKNVKPQAVNAKNKAGKSTSPQTDDVNPCCVCSSCLAIADGSHMDVIEIDAASNRGIDDIRSLQEKIMLSPVTGRKKVYIIDEVHMLTNEAFNALLKTLEEPPAHVLLILATTEVYKLPQTIISRCQRLNFGLASAEELKLALTPIIDAEKIKITDDALTLLIERAEGSFRDAEKLLDQVASLKEPITKDVITAAFRTSSTDRAVTFLQYLVDGDEQQTMALLTALVNEGENLSQFTIRLLDVLRTLALAKVNNASSLTTDKMTNILSILDKQKIMFLLKLFTQAERDMRLTSIIQLPLEMAVLEWLMVQQPDQALAFTSQTASVKGHIDVPKVHPEKETATQSKTVIVQQKTEAIETAHEREPIAPTEVGAMLAETSDNIVIASAKEAIEAIDGDEIPQTTAVGKQRKKKEDTALTIEYIRQLWPAFLRHVIANNHSVALLLKNAVIRDFSGSTITLAIVYKFHKERLENEKIRKVAEDALEQIYGVPLHIKCVFEQKLKNEAEAIEELSDIAVQIFSADS